MKYATSTSKQISKHLMKSNNNPLTEYAMFLVIIQPCNIPISSNLLMHEICGL